MDPPKFLMLAVVLFVVICAAIEIRLSRRRKRPSERVRRDRRSAVDEAERQHARVDTEATPHANFGRAPRRTRPRALYPANSLLATIGVSVVLGGVVITQFGWFAGLVVLAIMGLTIVYF